MDSITSTTSASWDTLPNELRSMILGYLVTWKEPRAPLASVSKNWQALMKRYTFSHIKLTASRLEIFERIVTDQRRTYVRYLWSSLELEEYPCHDCESDDDSGNDSDKENDEIDEIGEIGEIGEIDDTDETDKTGDSYEKNEGAKKNEGYENDEGYETDDIPEDEDGDVGDPFITRKIECAFIEKAFFKLFNV